MALTTIDNVKTHLSLTHFGDDALLTRLVDAESARFEAAIGQAVAVTGYTQEQAGDDTDTVVLAYGPVVAVASVTLDGVPQTDYTRSGRIVTLAGAIGRSQTVGIVYTAGWATAPADIEQAVIEMVALKFQERTHLGKQSQSIAGQGAAYLPSITPQSVQVVIDSYRRVD